MPPHAHHDGPEQRPSVPGTPEVAATPYRNLRGTGLALFPLCLGGNVFGFTADEAMSFAVLDAYAEAGGNIIDTADSYCHWIGSDGGESETIIGRWMRERSNRDEMIIATKVGQLPGQADLRAGTIRAAAHGSLRRLQTDRIDLYYAHEDHGDPTEETVEAFDALVRPGAVRYVAASNYRPARLREALDAATSSGLARYVALQPRYNLMDRAEYETDLAPLLAERGLGVLPWWGLASGYLTGKYRLGGPPVESARAGFVGQFLTQRGERVLSAQHAIATRHGVAEAAIALAWLRGRPGVIAPIASARTPEQLKELLPMATVRLGAEETAALDAASAVDVEPES